MSIDFKSQEHSTQVLCGQSWSGFPKTWKIWNCQGIL